MSPALALLASLLLGFAAATQHRSARALPRTAALSPRLVLRLLHDRWWLLAVALMVAGYGAQAAALGEGRLAMVEPILSSYLVVALVVAAARLRRTPDLGELAAAVATGVGIALFLIEVGPSAGVASAGSGWAPVLLGLAVLLALGAPAALRRREAGRALLLGALAGVALGVSDGLTKQTISAAAADHLGALAQWPPYALAVVGVVAFLLQQSAYHAGPLTAALPPLSVGEPVVGTVLGLALFQESASPRLSPPLLGVGLLLVVWGVQRLARSELISAAAPAPGRPR